MKLNLKANLLVVGKSSTFSQKANKNYYSIAVVNELGEAGNLSCDETCYNGILDTFKNYEIGLSYNDQYKFMQAVSAIPLK